MRGAYLGLIWLMGVAGCSAALTGIPALDAPDGRVFAERCGGCHDRCCGKGHGVPDPRFHTMSEWQEIVPRMDRLIGEQGLAPLSQAEREAIMRYLRQHAKAEPTELIHRSINYDR